MTDQASTELPPLPPLPPSVIARILSYNVSDIKDVAKLRLLSRAVVPLLPSFGARHFIKPPNKRTQKTFLDKLSQDSDDFEMFSITIGEQWFFEGVGRETDSVFCPFRGAGIVKCYFLTRPLAAKDTDDNGDNNENEMKDDNSKEDEIKGEKVEAPKELDNPAKCVALKRICMAIASATEPKETEKLGNEATTLGLLSPISNDSETNPEEQEKTEEQDDDEELEWSSIYTVMLSFSLAKDAPCIKKREEVDGVTILHLEAGRIQESAFFVSKQEVGTLFRAVVQSEISSQFAVDVLMCLIGNHDRISDVVYSVEPVTYTSVYESIWKEFQQHTVVEGVTIVDGGISEEFSKLLGTQIDALAKKQQDNNTVDYHPHSNNVVRDLVHPGLYSYVKDVSPLGASMDEVEPCFFPSLNDEEMTVQQIGRDFWGRAYEASDYQWLPTYFSVSMDGQCTIEDYINNLVPRESFTELYESLAKLFELALPYLESVFSYVRAVRPFFLDEDESAEYSNSGMSPLHMVYASFRGQKLQVITKIVDYELESGQTYEGVWHVEGMSHEEIVCTCLYILDRDQSIHGGALEFKRALLRDEAEYIFSNVSQIRHPNMETTITDGIQPLGTVETRKGRLIVFPNSHVHRVATLKNICKDAGIKKRRIVVFFLVNPHQRIISTREVAPQQGGSMTLEDAKEHRLKLMQERKYHKQDWNVREIELCEH